MMIKEPKGKKLVVANWKMNPATGAEALKMFESIKKTASKAQHVQTVICPPSLYLESLKKRVTGHRCVLGAQNCHWEKSGAFTGEHSPQQLSAAGAEYLIVGHSERRELGETNEMVNKKMAASLKAGYVSILCIGENKRDQMGEFLKLLESQIKEGLEKIPRKYFLNLVLAYEPVWALSSHATSAKDKEDAADMFEMVIFIRKILANVCGKDLAMKIPVIYGGSVDDKNVGDYFEEGKVDGVLVGSASLKPKIFSDIINIANGA